MMLEWSCPWVNGLDVHVALDRNLVPHHKLTAAIKNEVISCRNEQCHLEKKKKKSLTFSTLLYNQMQTKPFI